MIDGPFMTITAHSQPKRLPASHNHNLASKKTFFADGASLPAKNARLLDLESRVLASLIDSGYAALRLIGCDVDHNQVILRGIVPSYHLKQLAQVCALRVEGVGRIHNRLEVRGRGSY
jgi:hypothetical protein